MAGTLERARAAVVASPELRLWAERGRSLLYGPPHDAPVRHSEVSPWRPPQSGHTRVLADRAGSPLGPARRPHHRRLRAGVAPGARVVAHHPPRRAPPRHDRRVDDLLPHRADPAGRRLAGPGAPRRARRQHQEAPGDGRPGHRPVGHPGVARPAPALQRRLQLRRPGRDGQPWCRPQLHRPRRHRRRHARWCRAQRLDPHGRPGVAGRAGAVRPRRRGHQPGRRRGLRPRPGHLDLGLPRCRPARGRHGRRRHRPHRRQEPREPGRRHRHRPRQPDRDPPPHRWGAQRRPDVRPARPRPRRGPARPQEDRARPAGRGHRREAPRRRRPRLPRLDLAG